MTGWDTLTLSDEHKASLQMSGISPEIAKARGYYTAETSSQMPEGFSEAQKKRVPALILPVWGVDDTDTPITYRMRPDTPMEDKRGRNGSATVRKYEQMKGQALRLDVPPSVRPMLSDPSTPLVITEGEKKADAAASAGIVCISLPGVWGFRGTDSATGGKLELPDLDRIAWNARNVYVAFDSDVVDKKPVQQALSRLAGVLKRRGAVVHVLRLPSSVRGEKQGLDDVLAGMTGLSADERWQSLTALVDPAFWAAIEDDRKIDERLRDYILDEYELGQDENGNAFGLPKSGARIARMLYSGRPSLHSEAPVRFSQSDPRKPVLQQRVVKDVLAHVEGLCYGEARRKLHMRSAHVNGRLVIDLGTPGGERVVVTADGWTVENGDTAGDVLFKQTENITPLPLPQRGGSLEELRALLNVTDETWPLELGWLLAAFFGDVPRPWLYHTGPQGSGKSDAALFILSVVDPRPALQAPPRKGDRTDPAATAASRYLLGYDNMTSITQEHSDWLCALVTGATDERRVLHTTATMLTLNIQRSGILTGISVSGVRADLAERLVTVDFERITSSTRKAHGSLTATFAERHPYILGALLDALVIVLREMPNVDGNKLDVPRMADYAKILKAYDLGAGTDLYDAYRRNVLETFADRADDDPVASVVLAYVAEHGDTGEITPAELHTALSHYRDKMLNEGELQDESFWPNSAKSFGWALKGLVATLEGEVSVTQRRGSGGKRIVRLYPVRKRDDVLNDTESQNVTQNVTHETAGQSVVDVASDVSDVSITELSLGRINKNTDVTDELFYFIPIATDETAPKTSPNDTDDASSQVRGTMTGDVSFEGETSPTPIRVFEPCQTAVLHAAGDLFGAATTERMRQS